MNNIEKTKRYLIDLFNKSEYLNRHLDQKKYRLEHTFRVANIGKTIARKEGFDVEGFVIGCLLHDISYCYEMKSKEDWENHGRLSAEMVQEFLLTLDISPSVLNDISVGIEMHVDDKVSSNQEPSIFAKSIGDADNIDRFDVYRIHSSLNYDNFDGMSINEQLEYISNKLSRLEHFLDMKLQTDTAQKLWNEKILFQIEFFSLLKAQLESSLDVL